MSITHGWVTAEPDDPSKDVSQRNLNDHFGNGLDWFDVTFYGAVGDGVTNDAGAFSAAIAAASAAQSVYTYEPITVFVPPGDYRIESSIIVQDRVRLSATAPTSSGRSPVSRTSPLRRPLPGPPMSTSRPKGRASSTPPPRVARSMHCRSRVSTSWASGGASCRSACRGRTPTGLTCSSRTATSASSRTREPSATVSRAPSPAVAEPVPPISRRRPVRLGQPADRPRQLLLRRVHLRQHRLGPDGSVTNDDFDDWFKASILRASTGSVTIAGTQTFDFTDPQPPPTGRCIFIPDRNKRNIYQPEIRKAVSENCKYGIALVGNPVDGSFKNMNGERCLGFRQLRDRRHPAGEHQHHGDVRDIDGVNITNPGLAVAVYQEPGGSPDSGRSSAWQHPRDLQHRALRIERPQ